MADSDYQSTSGTLTFAPGDTTQDRHRPRQRRHQVRDRRDLHRRPVAARPTPPSPVQGTGTGHHPQRRPAAALDRQRQPGRGQQRHHRLVFTVTPVRPDRQTVTVDYATADGTATAARQRLHGHQRHADVRPRRHDHQTVTVPVNGDTKFETDETFAVNLSQPRPTPRSPAGDGHRHDPQRRRGPRSSASTSVSQAEGNSGTTDLHLHRHALRRHRPDGRPSTTRPPTAPPPSATATTGHQRHADVRARRHDRKTVTVTVNGDTKFEADETFTVNLRSPANATISPTAARPPARSTTTTRRHVSASATSASRRQQRHDRLVFTVTLSDAERPDGHRQLRHRRRHRHDGRQRLHRHGSGTLTFAPGVTTQTVAVPVNGDTQLRDRRDLLVNLSGPANATIADQAAGTGTILNDDAAPTLIDQQRRRSPRATAARRTSPSPSPCPAAAPDR